MAGGKKMSSFDRVIGYEAIKTELMQICDMIKNREIYEELGAEMPKGILLDGEPGLGKTLMANCFIEESGLKAYTVRRKKGGDEFIDELTEAFENAKANAPAVVLLDDMDKFANEDENHNNPEEYVAVQACIDSVSRGEVFIIATVNELYKLPDSLIRPGRFDRRIELFRPVDDDAFRIISHYLSDKAIADDVNMDDLSKVISYSSCAELETILNEAAIIAGYRRKSQIGMCDLVQAALKTEYKSPDNLNKVSHDELRKCALHEAGHMVVAEAVFPGSIGLVSIRGSGRGASGGFTRRCRRLERRPHHILISLAGKAAVEMYCCSAPASGCQPDIDCAFTHIREAISESATQGFGMVDVSNRYNGISESMNARSEAVVHAEMERYMLKTRDILIRNREFLEKAADALMEEETLLFSDIKAIKESVNVVTVEI